MLVSKEKWVNLDLRFDKSFDERVRNHPCIGYNDLILWKQICMNYIQWINECSMNSSMINKYVLLRVF